ncbi:MAG: hypothetical protein IT204_09865 [Fimbriimonadaceae bacterium]|nr:hypothetical protein [Fimbriimonadaceae bacterium]
MMRATRRLLQLAAVLLVGCSGGYSQRYYVVLDRDPRDVIELDGDTRPGGRALPLVGFYDATISTYSEPLTVLLSVDRDGSAFALVRFETSGRQIQLDGGIDTARFLTVEHAELRLDGYFVGAPHPLDPNDRFTSGVHWVGLWRAPDGRTGDFEGWHQIWPPGYHYYYPDHYDSYDPWYDDYSYNLPWWYDDPSGGGSDPDDSWTDEVDWSPPVDPDPPSWVPPDWGSGGDPPDTAGDPTDDDIVFRRGRAGR